jgi:hypothetical protein
MSTKTNCAAILTGSLPTCVPAFAQGVGGCRAVRGIVVDPKNWTAG